MTEFIPQAVAQDIATPTGFLGVPEPVLNAIGRLMVIAGRVKARADELATAFNLATNRLQMFATCKAIRRAMSWPVMPWITDAIREEVHQWTVDAEDAMDRRNTLIHATHAHRYESDGWQPVHIHQRTQEIRLVDLATFEAVVVDLVVIERRAARLVLAVHAPVAPNVWVPIFEALAGTRRRVDRAIAQRRAHERTPGPVEHG